MPIWKCLLSAAVVATADSEEIEALGPLIVINQRVLSPEICQSVAHPNGAVAKFGASDSPPARKSSIRACMDLNYLLGILCLILWIVALVDCIRSNNSNKVVWIIVIILLPLLGSILYFLLGRSKG